MDAKTQDAAGQTVEPLCVCGHIKSHHGPLGCAACWQAGQGCGEYAAAQPSNVTVRGNERVHYQPDANPGDRWMVTRDGKPRLWAESLYVIAQHLNLDVEEFNRCAALMEPPAAPRETGEALTVIRDSVRCMRIQEHNAVPDDKKDGIEVLDDVLALLDLFVPATPVRPVEGLSGQSLAEAWDASTPKYGHAWANLSVSVRQHVCDFAERIAAPSAPQEPRVEPSEGMVAMGKLWMAFWRGWQAREAVPVQGTPNGLADVRAAFHKRYPEAAALSTEARDASE